jgi:hypothetical protein
MEPTYCSTLPENEKNKHRRAQKLKMRQENPLAALQSFGVEEANIASLKPSGHGRYNGHCMKIDVFNHFFPKLHPERLRWQGPRQARAERAHDRGSGRALSRNG